MATLPRVSKITNTTTSNALFQRPVSEFDSGLNTSAAWTGHLVSGPAETGSLSDEEPDDDDGEPLRSARALYDFEGKMEFRELSVASGDPLDIVKEGLADGWSLVKNSSGEIGLLPRSYYTYTTEFLSIPDPELLSTYAPLGKGEASPTGSITPRGVSSPTTNPKPILPQNTGEWLRALPSFRRSLLGGKSLNRFSSFVTSGAEEFILKGAAAEAVVFPSTTVDHSREATNASVDEEEINKVNRLGLGEADRHFVDAGPSWKEKIPPFRVLVHSPSKRTSIFSGAYTVYSVTSLFQPPAVSETDEERQDDVGQEQETFLTESLLESPTRITVYRRFSQFVILHTALSRRLPGVALPPLPEKQYAGRFSDDFVEARRGDLERYITKIVRHPVARYAEIVTFFLGCESDAEWKRSIPHHLAMPVAGPTFYACVFYPAFNLDSEDAAEAVDRFEIHIKAIDNGVQNLRNIFGRVREARVEMSKAERLLAYSLLSLITSKPLAVVHTQAADSEDGAHNKGLRNNEGAWCWRDSCQDCLKLTKAIQKTSETMQSIGSLYDDHARRTQLATHESLKGMAHPSSLYEPIVTTHKSTLSRYDEATHEGRADEEVAARCETVLNSTMAEMDTYHVQKMEDFSTLTKEHLDGEIRFYQQVLNRLMLARNMFESPTFDDLGDSPCQPSMYERELENPRLADKPLLQPCPHVFDSAPMRPVSAAIQEGVGLFLGPSTRGSVFGKFW